MNSIGSYLPPVSYTQPPGRGESARPVPATDQSLNPGSAKSAAPDVASGELTPAFPRTEGPVATEAPTGGRSEAQVRQELTGKEAELELVEQAEIRELAARDREVRAHEQAHMAVGGQYAGGVSYDYARGPDGRLYAVGGSVSIDISPVPGDPAATIDKMQQVQRAALAPAEPSGPDRAVAAQAAQMIAQARAEMATRNVQGESSASAAETESEVEGGSAPTGKTAEAAPVASGTRELATYRQINLPALDEQAAFRASA